MQTRVLEMAITMFVKLLTPEALRRFAGVVLDFIENAVLGTASDVDDRIVLPLAGMIRQTFGLED